MNKSKMRKTIRRLERENLELIIEANAARVRAGEWQEAAVGQAEDLDAWLERISAVRPN